MFRNTQKYIIHCNLNSGNACTVVIAYKNIKNVIMPHIFLYPIISNTNVENLISAIRTIYIFYQLCSYNRCSYSRLLLYFHFPVAIFNFNPSFSKDAFELIDLVGKCSILVVLLPYNIYLLQTVCMPGAV